MSIEGGKKNRLEALINHYSNGNKSEFARVLGVKPQTINSWINRGTYDTELIYSKCIGVSASWLLTGKGDMILDKSVNNTSQQVNGDNNTVVGRDLTSNTSENSKILAVLTKQQETISELVSTVSRQQKDISKLIERLSPTVQE